MLAGRGEKQVKESRNLLGGGGALDKTRPISSFD
jgi:hypothetical protein